MSLALQNIVNAIGLGCLYALIALGIALIFGVMRLINFAHGELIMVGAFTVVILSKHGWIIACLGAVVITALTAMLMERVALRPVRGAEATTLLITAFAVSFFLQNLSLVTVGQIPRSGSIFPSLTTPIAVGSVSTAKLNLVIVVVTIVLVLSLTFFLNFTRLGVQMRASAEDFGMARLLGVNADRVIAAAFTISGVLAATAAIFLVAQNGVAYYNMGSTYVLIGFSATILGGMGSLRAAAAGAFVIAGLTVALDAYLPFEYRPYRDAFLFTGVLVVLVIRPQGLFPSKALETRV